MTIHATNILWDTDGYYITLPDTVEIPKEIYACTDHTNTTELCECIVEAVSDYVTNTTGFCHKGFTIKNN